MEDHTDNQQIAAEMLAAHRELGSWAKVAKRLGTNPKTGRPYSGTMAWFYGTGRREITDAVAKAWKRAGPRKRVPRVSIEVSPHTRNALRNGIKKHGDTWDDAFKRILDDTEPGSVSHLFGMLGAQALFAVKDDLDLLLVYQEKGWWEIDPGYTDADIATVHWWLDRLELELSMRKTPDWARED